MSHIRFDFADPVVSPNAKTPSEMEKLGETPASLSAEWSNTKIGLEHLQEEIESMGISKDTAEVYVLRNREFVNFARNFPWKDEVFFVEGEGPRNVEVYVDVNHVSSISSLDNTFEAQIDIELFWKPLKEEVMLCLQSGDSTVNAGLVEFRPVVNVANAKSTDVVNDWTNPKLYFFPGTGEFYFQTKQNINVLCLEGYEFKNFPFDVQDLCIKLVPTYDQENKKEFVRLVPHDRYRCICSFKICELNDFYLHNKCVTEVLEGDGGWDVINIRLKAIRRWQHYIYRLCGILSLVTLSGCLGFRIDIEDGFSDATAYFSTVLLTVVAFMFVVHSTLPPIPYLTLLDKFIFSMLVYVIVQMIFLALFTVESVHMTESFAFWFSIILWIIIHVLFAVWGYFASVFEQKKLTMNTMELREHMGSEEIEFVTAWYDPQNKENSENFVWRKFMGDYI